MAEAIYPEHGGVLNPIAKGEVRNPTGRNQFTYRRDAEAIFERLVKQADRDDPTKTTAEVILEGILQDAKNRGDEKVQQHCRQMVLDRLLPKPQAAAIQLPSVEEGQRVTFAMLIEQVEQGDTEK